MLKVLRKAGAIFDRILNVCGWAAAILLNIAMLLVCCDVLLRYFLNRPLRWGVEVNEYILMGITSFGLAWLLKENGHVNVDLVQTRLKPRVRAMVNAISSGLCTIGFAIIVWYGAGRVWHLYLWKAQTTKVLFLPKAPLVGFLVMGCLLLVIQLARKSWEYWNLWKSLGSKQNL
jgi:TRAP-type C4-dicarboxylate transport system permease small subunit